MAEQGLGKIPEGLGLLSVTRNSEFCRAMIAYIPNGHDTKKMNFFFQFRYFFVFMIDYSVISNFLSVF